MRGRAASRPARGVRADSIAAVTGPRLTTRALGRVAVAASLSVTSLSVTSLVTVGLATAALIAGPGADPAAASSQVRTAAADEDDTPLSITLTAMTPSEIPRKGAITLTGMVTNTSIEPWTDINVSPFISQEPITTRDELAEAAETPPDSAVGDRLTDPGAYVTVDELDPGKSAPFTLRMPVTSLLISGDPGVYWIGVHALGSNLEGRDVVADGRARTFIPLVPPDVARRRTVPVSVVLPLRDRARRDADGSLNGPTRWVNLTRSDGRLRRLADFGASSGDAPVSWLVDPAVLDALSDFGNGNPPLSLGPPRRVDDEGGSDGVDGPGPSPGEPEEESSESPSPSASPKTGPGAPDEAARQRTQSVLTTFLSSTRTNPVLALGYADPDVVALARLRPSLIRRADDLAARRMQAWGLDGRPVVAPRSGYFDPEVLSAVPKDSLLLLTDRGRLQTPTLSDLPSGHQLLMSDERAVSGGPAPTAARDPLALRQRVLSEAALEATKGDEPPRPVVLNLPARWNPGPHWRDADFFGGLQTQWLRISPLPDSNTIPTYDGELAYDRAEQAKELGSANVDATRTLTHTSGVLGNLLANENTVTDRLTGAALQASALSARPTPRLAATQVLELDATTRVQMERVQVTGTDFVTLSGGSGSLTVTLVNGLKQPITVGLRARTDSSRVEVETPDPVNMQPGQRTTLRLQVTSSIGVHDVTLFPVTTSGEATGTPLTFNLRTSQVGRLIWYILAAGGTLLVVMIVRRIVLRLRGQQWRRGESA